MRFGIGDNKAFTSLGKMYALANVWMESGLGWGDSMKRMQRTWCTISTKSYEQ